MLSKKLQRQIKRAFGDQDFGIKLAERIETLKSQATLDPAHAEELAHCKGLLEFFGIVQGAYDQSDKMLAITGRSLTISSDELNLANQQLQDLNKQVESVVSALAESLNTARDIQQSLIPPLEQDFGGTCIGALYRPSEVLSGDFFDVFQKGELIYFYLADVTSHGVVSAQVTYLIKGIFNDIMAHNIAVTDVSLVMSEFCRRFAEYRLKYAAGIQIGRFNLDSGELIIASSNVPLPIRIRNGVCDFLSVEQGPLLDTETYDFNFDHKSSEFTLLQGDQVFFFTDGATDFSVPDGAREFTERDLSRILKKLPTVAWQDSLIQQLIASTRNHTLDDDVTVLKFDVKRLGW